MEHLAFVFVKGRTILDRRFPFHNQLLGHLIGVRSARALDGWLRETGAQLGNAQIEGMELIAFQLYRHDGLAFGNRNESINSPEVWQHDEDDPEVVGACKRALEEALNRGV
jgi:hypothetical protein